MMGDNHRNQNDEEGPSHVNPFAPGTVMRAGGAAYTPVGDDEEEYGFRPDEDAGQYDNPLQRRRSPGSRRRSPGSRRHRESNSGGGWNVDVMKNLLMAGCLLMLLVAIMLIGRGRGHKDSAKNNASMSPSNSSVIEEKKEPESHSSGSVIDVDLTTEDEIEGSTDTSSTHKPTYQAAIQDPFRTTTDPTWYGSVFVPPPFPTLLDEEQNGAGYLQYPNVHNNTLVFVTEGDLYLTNIFLSEEANKSTRMPAMRLTSTVGNVNSPHINSNYPYLVAFTATYTGHREAYLIDLRHRSSGSVRLTYIDSQFGVMSIDGWEDEGTTLVVSAQNMEVGLEDTRLYKIGIMVLNATSETTTTEPEKKNRAKVLLSAVDVSGIEPVPLSQAIDSVVDNENCRYFVRFKQPSNTARYVGGTAEKVWAYCDGQELAIGITLDYNGTSKAPRIYTLDEDEKYLLFLSDRIDFDGKEWTASSMNLWAMELPSEDDLYPEDGAVVDAASSLARPFAISSVACQFNGIPLSEYAIDNATGNIVLKIGADFHALRKENVVARLKKGNGSRRLKDDATTKTKKKKKKEPDSVKVTNSSSFENLEKKATPVPIEGIVNVEKVNTTNSAEVVTPSESIVREIIPLPIVVYSDFNNLQERLIKVSNPKDVLSFDVYHTSYGTLSALMAVRGQLFVNPVITNVKIFVEPYGGGSMNMPPRRYRVAPGSVTGGMVRIMGAWYVPRPPPDDDDSSRLALVLATNPQSRTAELGFYLIETGADVSPAFADIGELPIPIVGGEMNGSVADGGLGSVLASSVKVSPCGRRFAWTDTDGRIMVAMFPLVDYTSDVEVAALPRNNENGEPVIGGNVALTWSPGGRYLAIEHSARNQFQIISIADLGDPGDGYIISDPRIVQATPDRFNSMNPYWGRNALDFKLDTLKGAHDTKIPSTTLYFFSDRDVVLSNNESPWGSRAPYPSFRKTLNIYALPLVSVHDQVDIDPLVSMFGDVNAGGGAAELMMRRIDSLILAELAILDVNQTDELAMDKSKNATKDVGGRRTEKVVAAIRSAVKGKKATAAPTSSPSPTQMQMPKPVQNYPTDVSISFGPKTSDNLDEFARRSYVLTRIPAGNYLFMSQLTDDSSLVVAETGMDGPFVKLFNTGIFPSDTIEALPLVIPKVVLQAIGLSTTRDYLYLTYNGITKVIANTAVGFVTDFVEDKTEFDKNIVDTGQWALSVWPALEYQQLYSDAWRMLRDYYYDPGLGNVDWKDVHERYLPLVKRCSRREELDDVLKQMASELSALHVFVHGGEYNDPLHEDVRMRYLTSVASLGAVLTRSVEWGGYIVREIPTVDPDFNPVDGMFIYSPLSERTLRMSGQRGLEAGDVIVAINGESVMKVPDIHMMLRGTAGRSVRLEVRRIKSRSSFSLDRRMSASEREAKTNELAIPEPVIVVPISAEGAANLRYAAWEWKTRQNAKALAAKAGFTVGYAHLRSMSGAESEDSFVRGFFPDYDKDALIIDVRHNLGGNIDSWLLDTLQRKAWMYWQSRAKNITNGGLGWDEQFAFRGHLIVLMDESTSSDGEGFSRGVSELGLGKLVGTRTWGGGIWLSSDNHLVDGGIATAPEVGTYNNKFGWGLGIEQMGVSPDIEVDNNPRETYDGQDQQLERAIKVLSKWLKDEPVVLPNVPGPHRDVSLHGKAASCPAELLF